MRHKLNHWLLFILVIIAVRCTTENKRWEKAKLNNTISSYKDFLKQYPQGVFVDSANLQLEHLYYKQVDSVNTISAYEHFLKQYPQDIFTDSANFRIEQIFFKEAQEKNTLVAYKDFIERYPKGNMKDKATSCLEKFYMERHPSYRHTRKIKIIVEYKDNIEGDSILPFEAVARSLSKHAGLTVVEADSKDFDVTLNIHAKGYSGDGEARLSGLISLKMPSNPGFVKTFEYYWLPDFYNVFSKPFNKWSSFSGVFWYEYNRSYFIPVFFNMMSDIYGVHTLISTLKYDKNRRIRAYSTTILRKIDDERVVESLNTALHDEDDFVSYKAADALVNMKDKYALEIVISALKNKNSYIRESAAEALLDTKDTRAIEPLIDALKDKNEDVRRNANAALRRITKLSTHYKSHDQWYNWWEQNKHKYLDEK